jgi:isopentenyl diphosphate isomerase/L-lactate dehydrogenase-like FMN-dependent dehydrogenase
MLASTNRGGGVVAKNEWLTIPEIVRAARQTLPQHLWDHATGGADSETTLRRNRDAFDRWAFRPRVLRDVRGRDTSTTFLGQPLSLPVMFAPVGSVGQFHDDGALACARVAERVGTAEWVSAMASPSIEAVRDGADCPLVFQIYVRGDRAWLEKLVHRVEAADYQALCLTVDSSVYGRRDRDLHNRYRAREAHARPNLSDLPNAPDDQAREDFQAALSWDDVRWLRETTKLPFILKGIMDAEDAQIAVNEGVDVIYISNHGGRQLDHVPGTMDVLPEIVQAVGDRADVIVDGGFMRGADVLKALALGAKSVLIGKLATYGLGAGGEAGLERAMELLQSEMTNAMGNIGVRTIAELGPGCVRPSYPPSQAPWPYGSGALN